MTIAPTQLIWTACGSPMPFDADGEPIPKAKAYGDHCAMCNANPASYSVKELISSTFVPTRNENRLSGFGGSSYCAACVFCARTLRLRCISWFATADGIEFFRTRPETPESPRPDALARTLQPPEPPFVLGMPLYGVSHGGENHWQRTAWTDDSWKTDPLVRLQSKHVAIYSRVSYSRDRYPVQVDDALDFVLDRDLWLRLREAADKLMARCMDDGVPPYPSKLALESLKLPNRVSPALAIAWRELATPIAPYIRAPWWGLFCSLYPTPKDTREPDAKTRRTAKPERRATKPQDGTTPAVVPAESDGLPDKRDGARKGPVQQSLFGDLF